MTIKDKIFATLFGLLILTALILYFFPSEREITSKSQVTIVPEVSPSPAQEFADEIEILMPRPDTVISSPLSIAGRARGTWFFEANMPVTLLDGNKNVLAKAPLQAEGEWMTADFVPFSGKIIFEKPETDMGVLVFENDNPSGLSEHAKSFTIPVRFK